MTSHVERLSGSNEIMYIILDCLAALTVHLGTYDGSSVSFCSYTLLT